MGVFSWLMQAGATLLRVAVQGIGMGIGLVAGMVVGLIAYPVYYAGRAILPNLPQILAFLVMLPYFIIVTPLSLLSGLLNELLGDGPDAARG